VHLAEGLVPLTAWPESATLWKMGFAATVAGLAAWLFHRAGRPGMPAGVALAGLALLAGLVAAVGLADHMTAPAAARMQRLMGHSSLLCPVAILVLSLPVLAAMLAVGRQMAPERPGLLGAAAGLVAGGVAAAAYGLICTEGALVFVATWYSAGLALAALAGWAIGRRVLRW
jgi:hypothetical protein